jgi:hypothetical protein
MRRAGRRNLLHVGRCRRQEPEGHRSLSPSRFVSVSEDLHIFCRLPVPARGNLLWGPLQRGLPVQDGRRLRR